MSDSESSLPPSLPHFRDSQTGDCCLGHLTNGCPDDALPTPDHTNPTHLRFAAGAWEGFWDFAGISGGDDIGPMLRAEADRLEAAQQQADADEVAVTKVVEELTLAGIGNDTPSDYYEIAVEGALIAAGLLQGGDEK